MALRLKASEALEKLWRFTAILLAAVILSSLNTLAEEASTVSSEDGISVQSHTCSSAFSFNLETHYIADSLNEKEARWYKTSISQDGELGIELDGPSSADFDLYVYESCSSSWVCRPYEDDADEYCKIDARKGDYYIKVNAYRGKGSFNLYADLFRQDLIVSDIWTTPANVDEKTAFDLHWSVKNLGKDKIIDDFESELYVGDKLKKECSITKDMVSGEAVECHWLDQTWTPGEYTAKAVADTDNDVFETNENNNERTETLTVKNAPKYDLAPAYILVDPYDPTDKDKLMLRYPIANAGPDDIKGKVALKSFIDDNNTICITNDGIVARDKIICEREITLKAGWYKLKTIADPDNEIPETDETNNEHQQDLLVSHMPNYDLAITKIWTSPGGELNDKMTFSVTAEIVNSGSDDITDSFKASLGADDNPLMSKECLFSGLKAGTSAFCTLENQKWTAGKHTVYAYVDIPDRQIPETDDDYNNEKKAEFDVAHVPETDLTVASIYTDPASPTEKDTFSVKFDIKNAGSEAVPSGFKSNVFINSEPKGTWCYTINLGAGATQTCSFDRQKWAPGSYAVRVFADAEDAINELIETNNELEKQIEISQYCKIKDGSAADCDCNTNADCPSGYYCSLKEGYDPCKPLACKDECTPAGYLCSQGDSYECGNFDSDQCLEKKLKQVCSLSQKCSPAKGGCEEAASPVKLQLEDSPSHDITVYKQPGDTVEVTMTSDKLQDIEFSQPENFTLLKGICGSKTAAAPGETKCLFQISETTANGEYYFVANEKTATVTVIEKPKAVIITNKQKLNERFPNDKAGVKALLEQAYQYASNEKNTVVYYMDREIGEHPFESYSNYGESILSPEMTDNSYSLNTAAIVAEKCGDCANIIILGDDFVLPFYRADYAFIHNWWKWWVENKSDTRYLYSDQPYIKEKKKTMGDLASLFDRSQHKKVKLVVPDTTSSDVQSEIDKTKEAVKAFSYSESDLKQIKSSEIGCNSYSALDEATLILIGTREDNNAIKCVPWFDIGSKPTDTFKASIEIERNVWANNEYAIIVSGKDIVSGLQNLHAIIANPDHFQGTALGGKDTVYIHDFSNPPDLPPGIQEMGSHVFGFALGTCEEGKLSGEKGACIATDMVAGIVPPTDVITDIRDTAIYCIGGLWNKITGKKGDAFTGLMCGGSLIGTLSTGFKYVTAATVVGAAVGEGADIATQGYKSVLKVAKAAMKGEFGRFLSFMNKIKALSHNGFLKFAKIDKDITKLSKSDLNVIRETVTRVNKVTAENSRYVNKLLNEFGEDTLSATIKNVDDYENMVAGMKKVKNLDEVAPGADKLTKAKVIKNIGRYTDDVIEKYTHVLYEPAQKFVFRGKEITSNFPFKIVNGEKKVDWEKLEKGVTGINKAPVDLDYIKKLPEAEKATYAKLSMSHLGKSKNIFISASKVPNAAAKFGKGGYVFLINPRARNALDVDPTITKQYKNGEISQADYSFYFDQFAGEAEVAFIEKIDFEDIIGVAKVDSGTVPKIIKGTFEANPKYISGTLEDDIDIAKKIVGG